MSEAAERTDFPCSTCGAPTAWDPEADALSCAYCGSVAPVPRAEGTIVERPLEEAGEAARGLGRELQALACSQCGARVLFEARRTAELCVYCGSPRVLAQQANRNALRPESLIPLEIGREGVEAAFRSWLGRLWLRPGALRKTRRFEAAGIYVPFWTFDCRVRSDWTADAGHYYWVEVPTVVHRGGRRIAGTRRERRVRWVPARGSREDVYDDLLVHATRGLPHALVRRLGAFDTEALVPYRPEYLAGWLAEEYQIDLAEGWRLGRETIEETQRRRCAGDVPGDTQRRLRAVHRIEGVRWKHVLLPVWSLQYRFRGKVYTVLVHGQSGHVVGEAPYSLPKVLLLVLFVAAAILLIALLTRK